MGKNLSVVLLDFGTGEVEPAVVELWNALLSPREAVRGPPPEVRVRSPRNSLLVPGASSPFHENLYTCGKGFFGQTRRERRAYPAVDL